jgi:heat shock protein HslJ
MYRIFLILLALSACSTEQSMSKLADRTAEYVLIAIDGVPFAANATLRFTHAGEITGQAPCNTYFAARTVPYPWFGMEGIGATRMACPELAAEAAYFTALEDMTQADVTGRTLALTNSNGRRMVFEAR